MLKLLMLWLIFLTKKEPLDITQEMLHSKMLKKSRISWLEENWCQKIIDWPSRETINLQSKLDLLTRKKKLLRNRGSKLNFNMENFQISWEISMVTLRVPRNTLQMRFKVRWLTCTLSILKQETWKSMLTHKSSGFKTKVPSLKPTLDLLKVILTPWRFEQNSKVLSQLLTKKSLNFSTN